MPKGKRVALTLENADDGIIMHIRAKRVVQAALRGKAALEGVPVVIVFDRILQDALASEIRMVRKCIEKREG